MVPPTVLKISLAAFLFIIPYEIHADDIALPKSYSIRVAQGNVREKPSTKASIIGRVNNGEKVTLIERADKWFFAILPNGKTGWIHQTLVLSKKKELVLKAIAGNIRKKPSRSSPVKKVLKKGDTVSIIGSKGNWYHIRLGGGETGWSHKSLFRVKAVSSQRHKNPPSKLKRLETAIVTDQEERILITLSDFVPPRVFTIEGRRPMVVCDFSGVGPGLQVEESNKADGRIIRSVNVLVHSVEEPITRIIIELFSKHDYDIQQVFYKEENLYVLNIKQM